MKGRKEEPDPGRSAPEKARTKQLAMGNVGRVSGCARRTNTQRESCRRSYEVDREDGCRRGEQAQSSGWTTRKYNATPWRRRGTKGTSSHEPDVAERDPLLEINGGCERDERETAKAATSAVVSQEKTRKKCEGTSRSVARCATVSAAETAIPAHWQREGREGGGDEGPRTPRSLGAPEHAKG